MKTVSFLKKHRGMTLMEILASLAIISAVVVGALALFGSASSSQIATQLTKDIFAVRSAVQQLYMGQGGYGTASLNQVLIDTKKLPSTLKPGASAAITTYNGGDVTVTGATGQFTIAVTDVPYEICVPLLTNLSTGWSKVQVTGKTAIDTFPVSVATATTGASSCDTAAAGGTITWTSTN